MKTTKPFGLRLFALLSVFAMIVAACIDDTTETTASDEEGAATTQADDGTDDTVSGDDDDGDGPEGEGGIFNVGFISNITTDNWWAALDTQVSTYNLAYLNNGKTSLYGISLPGFVYIPGIAATDRPVAAVEEGDVWVVEQPIRDDFRWSDGEPVTANDLVFYFDTVREFSLGSNHAANFPPTVLGVTAPDDYTVRVEFSEEPGLAVWQNGVGFADFVPSHFWQPHVEEARAAAEEVAASLTDEEAVESIVEASLVDDNPDNDLTGEDITQEMIDEWKSDAVANEGLTVLYAVESPQEPSVGSQIFDEWQTGAFAATVSNASYPSSGDTNTFYSDGSFAITPDGGETTVYGGEGAGDVVAQYVEGPFVSEILWIEHGSKDAAYEKLEGGELDYVYDPNGLTSGLRNELANNPDLEFAVNQDEGFRYMAFNLRKAPMSDPAFRQAVATVIDKELVAETVLAGAAFPGYTVIHPDFTTFYNPDVNRPGWEDGEPMNEAARYTEAVQILKDTGYTWEVEPFIDPEAAQDPVQTGGEGLTMPNGEPVPDLEILAPGPGYDPLRGTFAIWIETFMKDLGIPVTYVPSDFNAIRGAVFPPQTPESATGWDMYIMGWGGGDPSLAGTSLVTFFHSREDVANGGFNTPGYKSEEFDAISDAFEAATTIEEAAELTKEMEAIIQRDLPYVVLFRTPIIEVFNATTQFPVDTVVGGHQGFANAWPNAVVVTE